jgi:hypothetical protein
MAWLNKKRIAVSAMLLKVGMASNPFGNVIYNHDNVLVSITRWRMESHEVYAPFTEGADYDD